MMIRVRREQTSAVPPLSQALLQRPGEQTASEAYVGPDNTLEDIQQLLGIKEVRCFTRRDGQASAYCGARRSGSENSEAAQLAKRLGIQVPNEALPLQGNIVFLGPSVEKYSNL